MNEALLQVNSILAEKKNKISDFVYKFNTRPIIHNNS